ncbi:hypothetical protein LOC54_03485 [Acetobacter sp. AN02]|uniref:hypothetical protein n=1 Tax=Acetobacter sp. AN02 TaxID=2894186 RepID=UPI0024341FDE|nr:hypothetical protein [Acetobacter sp. AN02]MDG6094186.1 hypothetical protein [Acetobacter sp. AN02]
MRPFIRLIALSSTLVALTACNDGLHHDHHRGGPHDGWDNRQGYDQGRRPPPPGGSGWNNGSSGNSGGYGQRGY